MPAITIRTVVKLLLWSLLVGVILSWLDISPSNIVTGITTAVRELLNDFQTHVWRLGSYILLGAIIVVPIWAIRYLLRATRK